jgi:hypothetical protein
MSIRDEIKTLAQLYELEDGLKGICDDIPDYKTDAPYKSFIFAEIESKINCLENHIFVLKATDILANNCGNNKETKL